MQRLKLTRRAMLLGPAFTLAGCGAITSLNDASRPLDTYLLSPAVGATSGRRTSRTIAVARPDASAAIATDRIMVKSGVASISYLPDARWSDELPAVVQSLLIRSISGTGRIGYVGKSEGGPVPDVALLVRIDAFEVVANGDGTLKAVMDMTLTVMTDRTQAVIATRGFTQSAVVADDSADTITIAFQSMLDELLPEISNWVIRNS